MLVAKQMLLFTNPSVKNSAHWELRRCKTRVEEEARNSDVVGPEAGQKRWLEKNSTEKFLP